MKSLQGHFLIASPDLLDPHFFHAVVLIVQHDENGAMGVILNRPTEMTMGEAWKQVSDMSYDNSSVVYQGGPCEGPLMVLHTQEAASQIEVLPGVHFTTDAASVTQLIELDADPLRFFVGYAGWQAQQLEAELADAGWLLVRATADQIFCPPDDLWTRLIKAAVPHSVVANINPKLIPPDPSVN